MLKKETGSQAATLELPESSAPEQQIYDYVVQKALAEVSDFESSNTPKSRIFVITNLSQRPMLPLGDIEDLSPHTLGALIETMYTIQGVSAPSHDLSRWVYDASGHEHVATTATDHGFDIVETRFLYENSDPAVIPDPQKCGLYTLDLVRHSE